MSLLNSAVLGMIQGLCEFLPVSSSGHLLLARILLGIQTDTPSLKMLDIILHVGTLIPIIIYFRKDWIHMIAHPVKDPTLRLLFIASLPTLAIYLLAKKLFPDYGGFDIFENGWFLGVSFLITAVFLLICDSVSSRSSDERDPGIIQALIMGLFQGIGMVPGISRSGSTILGGSITGLSKTRAARFSFMMSMPAVVGSLLMEGKDAIEEGYFSEIDPVPAVIGAVIAAIFGYAAIRIIMSVIGRIRLSWFSLYLAVIGVIYLLLQLVSRNGFPALALPEAEVFGSIAFLG